MNRLSVGLNASYIYTNLVLDILNTDSRNSGLEGASPFLTNTDISYHHTNGEKSLTASLILNYYSDRIHTIGATGFNDIMEEGVATLDFATTYGINRNLSIKFKASNLLNSAYKLSRESSVTNDIITLSEFKKGQNISLGISYEF
jgi:outer membrane receptor protein involved in Fe transport